MEVVMPMELEQSVCRDRDDDVVLGTARAASADCIVTGDRDLLVIRQYEGVEIVAPSDFAGFEEEKGKR
jgi:predicted nucleic acid-binding protein